MRRDAASVPRPSARRVASSALATLSPARRATSRSRQTSSRTVHWKPRVMSMRASRPMWPASPSARAFTSRLGCAYPEPRTATVTAMPARPDSPGQTGRQAIGAGVEGVGGDPIQWPDPPADAHLRLLVAGLELRSGATVAQREIEPRRVEREVAPLHTIGAGGGTPRQPVETR